jgi:hypothetical protein
MSVRRQKSVRPLTTTIRLSRPEKARLASEASARNCTVSDLFREGLAAIGVLQKEKEAAVS